MSRDSHRLKTYAVAAVVLIAVVILVGLLAYQKRVSEEVVGFFHFLSDKNRISAYISTFGMAAPLVFMGVQMLQVIAAPVPGEMTGFVGGYLFGTWPGFIYSSIALTLGSIINFSIGRFFGRRFIRRLVPPKHLDRFDVLIRHEGALVVFILFVFPGFPKDYLCLFLGMSAMPLKIFAWLSAVGRMPGTLMLSLQGSVLFSGNYSLLLAVAGASCMLVFLSYYYREALYRWIEKQKNSNLNG